MRKVLFLTAVLAFVGFSNAQQKMDAKSLQTTEVRNNFEAWSADLGLTDAQQTQIQAIYKKATQEKEAIRSTGTAKDFKEITDRQETAINAILTPAQLTKVKEIEAARNQQKIQISVK